MIKSKIRPSLSPEGNFGYDTPTGHYRVGVRDHIAYRYEIHSVFGRGVFGQVLKCYDHKKKEFVAIKVLVNTDETKGSALAEIGFLSDLALADETRTSCVARMLDTFDFRGHVCAVFEPLGPNLYEYVRKTGFSKLRWFDIRRIARDVLWALAFTHAHGIAHCDVKPENVLLVPNKSSMSVKLTDFGSACRIGESQYSYVQSRFYRAPEVIFGLPYGPPVDIWSWACVVAELVRREPIFSGENEAEVLCAQMEVIGPPPSEMIEQAPQKADFFDEDGSPLTPVRSGTTLQDALRNEDSKLIDLLSQCFQWEQEKRITAAEALNHPFLCFR
jgi:dual specificity tyrosine-phosphorylation-regulated kinase 2/3/4